MIATDGVGASAGDEPTRDLPARDLPTGDLPALRLLDAVRRLAEHTRGRKPTGTTHHDADETTGTLATDDAVGFDPFPMLRALDQAGARCMVIGQVAGIMHGSRELTGDLDLLWDGDAGHGARVAAGLARAGARLTDDDGVPVPCTAASLRGPKVLFRTGSASGDCCTPALPWGGIEVGAMIGRCAVAEAPGGFRIRYLTCADLITMREAVGRPKDLRRAAELRELCRGGGEAWA